MSSIKHLKENWAIQTVRNNTYLFHFCWSDNNWPADAVVALGDKNCPVCGEPVPQDIETIALLVNFNT